MRLNLNPRFWFDMNTSTTHMYLPHILQWPTMTDSQYMQMMINQWFTCICSFSYALRFSEEGI